MVGKLLGSDKLEPANAREFSAKRQRRAEREMAYAIDAR